MSDPKFLAAEALDRRAEELVKERTIVRKRILSDCLRDTEIERDIAGCFAGIRALGYEPEALVPTVPSNKSDNLRSWLQGRNSIVNQYATLKTEFGLDDSTDDEGDANLRPELPRIADIAIERLKLAGEDGSKATAIRQHILDTYTADIHEKTVGMTLYRLSQENPPQVHRKGHIWFVGPPPAEPKETEVTSTEPSK